MKQKQRIDEIRVQSVKLCYSFIYKSNSIIPVIISLETVNRAVSLAMVNSGFYM